MAQGDFTKEETDETITTFKEVFNALPKKKQQDMIGHANAVFLFLEAAKKAAPSEKKG